MSAQDDRISSFDYARLTRLIHDQAGIRLVAEKKTMLEVRLKRRLRALGLPSYRVYCEYLFGPGTKDELIPLIDAVTTNKTDFFREPGHFRFLVQRALPVMTAESSGPLLIWSAGCSSGEEPYTLGMVLGEYAVAHPELRYRIRATDISTAILARAERAVFSIEAVDAVPPGLRRKYFMRSRDPEVRRLRVVPELRRLVEFQRLNLMDNDFGFREKADAIFCRNVLIYFDRTTQERILRKLVEQLVPHGYLFVGHAETLHEMDLPVEQVAPSLYRRIHVED